MEDLASRFLDAMEDHLLAQSTGPEGLAMMENIIGSLPGTTPGDPARWMEAFARTVTEGARKFEHDPTTRTQDRSQATGLSPDRNSRRMAELEARIAALEERIDALEKSGQPGPARRSPED